MFASFLILRKTIVKWNTIVHVVVACFFSEGEGGVGEEERTDSNWSMHLLGHKDIRSFDGRVLCECLIRLAFPFSMMGAEPLASLWGQSGTFSLVEVAHKRNCDNRLTQ